MPVLGIVLTLVPLGILAAALWWSWRVPYIGLGLLVAGMAFHSFFLMVLLRLETPIPLVRVFQAWKEILLVLLAAIALWRLEQARRNKELGSLLVTDWIAIALAIIALLYFLMPASVLHSDENLSQRLVGFRVIFLIPLLYFLGRALGADNDRQRLTVVWLCLGAAAAVTLFGVFELFFVPTRTWLDWGVNRYTAFLGFSYGGPSGLPENFFLSLPDGSLVRRMVSTYVSPLGIAYTAILLFPMGVAVIDRRVPQHVARWVAILTTLLVLGVALSITRLALFCLIGEAVLLWVLLRRAWIAALVPVLVIAAILALFPYTSIAPAVDRQLNPVHRSGLVWAISGNDSSVNEHYTYLIADLTFDLEHPLGLGTGASTIRYGKLVGTGESAVLGMFGDLGWVGGLLYVLLYLFAIWNGWRALRLVRRASLEEVMPVVALVGGLALFPITLTSDLWGDLSVTFLFWWVAGATATLATRSARAEAREPWVASPARA
jgi:hypothetical protein